MIDLNIQTTTADEAFQRLLAGLADKTPLMRELAGIMSGAVEENFAMEGRPKWLGLKPSTMQQRVGGKMKTSRGIWKNGAWSIAIGQRMARGVKILQNSGRLAGSMTPAWDNETSQVGTNVVYAAIQNNGGETRAHEIRPKYKQALAFGGHVVRVVHHPGSKIPARQFLVLDEADGAEIEGAALAYLRRVVG
ncbi:phage virion morphogenesis protein [Chromobacterium subtsugae]|uniref:phage virion morphogenesis protein n=1 Tax=Chromobacterium subtsugae TaxID=251747 RepID=UPI00069B1F0A|nr:phage virion morphogenesis protein [Chromobacterium subtsugae]